MSPGNNFYFKTWEYVATIGQAFYLHSRRAARSPFHRTPRLLACAQRKGVVTRVVTRSPKKPNSATRHVAKVRLTSELFVTVRLPGAGYLCARYNRILIRGGRANDLPGIGYTAIRGVYDFSPALFKRKRRSIYGVERPDGHTTHVRRCFRARQ